MPSTTPCKVFDLGKHSVTLLSLDPDHHHHHPNSQPPPKPLLVAAPNPIEGGEFPVVLLLHGYLLMNSFYSQLMQHVASHGFILVAPQLYRVAGPDSEEEIKSVASITNWLIDGLPHSLPEAVTPNLQKVALAGHSRGGKVAFALALGHLKPKLNFSAVIGIDPVDGMDRGKQTSPKILTYKPNSFNLQMPALVIGSGLGGVKKNPLFPPCSPEGVSHRDFFVECRAPACHFVAKEFGHLDMLDDETDGLRGKVTYCLCKSGKARRPMREFVGGAMVAFLRGYLCGEMEELVEIRERPESAPVELSVDSFLE